MSYNRGPLAIDQAGSYLNARNLPLESFSEHFEKRKHVILNHTPKVWAYYRQLGEDEQRTRLSVCSTWELSLSWCGSTEAEREAYTHFLTLAALFDHASVSQYLFELYHKASKGQPPPVIQQFLTDGTWDSFKYQDFIVHLASLSLLQYEGVEYSTIRFSLHPLVAEWLKLRLDAQGIHAYRLEAVNILKSVTDAHNGGKATLSFSDLQSTIAHLKACSAREEEFDSTSEDLLSTTQNANASFAAFYLKADRSQDAEILLRKALRGVSDPETLAGLHHMLGRL